MNPKPLAPERIKRMRDQNVPNITRPSRNRPHLKTTGKAKVEAGVQVVERWILAALRHRTFFSLSELNAAIAKLLERLNTRPAA